MAYLARDGLYLRLIPGTNRVTFASPGGSPDRVQVEFHKGHDLSKDISYSLLVTLNGVKYWINDDGGFYLSGKIESPLHLTPLIAVSDTYNFQSFPGMLSSNFGKKNYQFMLEPTGALPDRSSLSSNERSCVLL